MVKAVAVALSAHQLEDTELPTHPVSHLLKRNTNLCAAGKPLLAPCHHSQALGVAAAWPRAAETGLSQHSRLQPALSAGQPDPCLDLKSSERLNTRKTTTLLVPASDNTMQVSRDGKDWNPQASYCEQSSVCPYTRKLALEKKQKPQCVLLLRA